MRVERSVMSSTRLRARRGDPVSLLERLLEVNGEPASMFARVLWKARPIVAVSTVVVAMSDVTFTSMISFSRKIVTAEMTTAVMMFLKAAGKLPFRQRTMNRSPYMYSVSRRSAKQKMTRTRSSDAGRPGKCSARRRAGTPGVHEEQDELEPGGDGLQELGLPRQEAGAMLPPT